MYCKKCGNPMEFGTACSNCGWKPGNFQSKESTSNGEKDWGKVISRLITVLLALISVLSIICIIILNINCDDFLVLSIMGEITFLFVMSLLYIACMGFAQLISDTREIKNKVNTIKSDSGITNEYLGHFLKDGVNVYVIEDDED